MMLRRIVGAHVADDQKAVEQLAALRIEQRKVLLMLLHRQDQAFLRHRQEGFVEVAFIDRRAFDQRGHFVEQQRLEVAEAGGAGGCAQLLANARRAHGE